MARILVADDEEAIRDLVELKLRRMGHDVTAVGDGEAALAAVRESAPDLIVLDWTMPLISGLEVCATLRADDGFNGTAIIMLTARVHESDVREGLDAGADDYMTKPFSPRELGQRVQAALASRPRSA